MNNFFTLNGEIAAVQVGVKNLEISADFDSDPGVKKFGEDLAVLIAEEIERAISSQTDRFRGQPGHSVGIDDVKKLVAEAVQQTIAANPERFRGLKGDPSTVPGPVGPAGKTVIVERNIIERGPKGDPGRDSTVPGPAGLDEKQITELVLKILTDANVVSEQQLKLLGLTIEMQNIRDDQSLHRLGTVREQLLKRLESKLL